MEYFNYILVGEGETIRTGDEIWFGEEWVPANPGATAKKFPIRRKDDSPIRCGLYEDMALHIVTNAFVRHSDLAGKPYLDHLQRVASKFKGEKKVAALLHDLLEDRLCWNVDALLDIFPIRVVDLVILLTRKNGQDYDEYIEQIAGDPDAIEIKCADLEDNMDIRRLPSLTGKDIERIAKYHKAWTYLKSIVI